jgi:16S rRNA (guanine1207-N2)-methyltransferase
VVFGSAPDRDHPGGFDVVTLRLPIGRIPTQLQLWTAAELLRPGGRCFVAGANDEGIRTALRQMEEVFGEADVLGYRGGNRVGSAVRPATLPEEALSSRPEWMDPDRFLHVTADTPLGELQLRSRPGVFSWDRLDAGSRALLEAMRTEPGEQLLELGCGHGVVGVAAAAFTPGLRATLVDVDAEAIRSARLTADANGVADRVEVIASDGAEQVRGRTFDMVVTNPPFHLEKGTNLAIPRQFIHDAAAALRPGGKLYLVANRTLPYERWLDEAFGSHQIARDGREFKVLSAVARPLQGSAAR